MNLQRVLEFAIEMWSEPGHRSPSFSLDCVRQFLRGAASRFQDNDKFLDIILELSEEGRNSNSFRARDLLRALDLIARAQSIPDFTLDILKSTTFSELSTPLSIQFVCIGIPRPTPSQILKYDILWPLAPEGSMTEDFATLVWSACVEENTYKSKDASGRPFVSVVDHVWTLVDSRKNGSIERDTFTMGMYLIDVHTSGNLLPHSMPDAARAVLQSWIEEARNTVVTPRIVATPSNQVNEMRDRVVETMVLSSAGGSNISDGTPTPAATDPAGSNASSFVYSRCPFCEKELPRNMPNYLERQLTELLHPSNSRPTPTTDNPDLREPTNGKFYLRASFCADHLCLTPASAIGQDWPSAGDVLFDQLEARVCSLFSKLNRLVCYPHESSLFRRLVKVIQAEGLAEVRSLDGLLRRMPFEHAGYYGERGSLIIHETLLNMFPIAGDHLPISVDPARFSPLDPAEFFVSVLVPETSILLIQGDRNCSWSVAKDHWKASGQYGMVMFR